MATTIRPRGKMTAEATRRRQSWEVIGRYTSGGKNAHVRVRLVSQPGVTEMRLWGAHERVTVKRTGSA